jgi:hypothetical protein
MQMALGDLHGHHGTAFSRHCCGKPAGLSCDLLLRIWLGNDARPQPLAENHTR